MSPDWHCLCDGIIQLQFCRQRCCGPLSHLLLCFCCDGMRVICGISGLHYKIFLHGPTRISTPKSPLMQCTIGKHTLYNTGTGGTGWILGCGGSSGRVHIDVATQFRHDVNFISHWLQQSQDPKWMDLKCSFTPENFGGGGRTVAGQKQTS